jgi:urocanate hydratase
MKNGKMFENPSQRLWELHTRSAQSLRSHRSQNQTIRSFSTQTKPVTAAGVTATGGFPVGTIKEIQTYLTDYVKINSWGQITSLPSSVDFTQPASLDPTLPHAPKRATHFTTQEDTNLAVTNALKYFHPSLHALLRPHCLHELETYGHIYFYHLMPPQHLWAIPYDTLPGSLMEGRAMTHMILNNLNPAVAQFPQELITYGGNGAVFGNWAQFHLTIHLLGKMKENQCLSMSSGHPQGLFPKSPNSDTPSAVISNGMMIPIYSTPEQLDRLYALGVSMYGQMTAGSWMYIGPQGIVHGTTLTVAQAIAMQQANLPTTSASTSPSTSGVSCRGKIFLTSGLGGMSGAQPKAATINGAICVIAEVDRSALVKRHQQGWLDEYYLTPEEVIARAAQAQEKNESLSIGYLGNVIELWEYLANTPPDRRRCVISVGSDQTSLHNPYNGGYYPVGYSFEEANELMSKNPQLFKQEIQKSLHRHLNAVNTVRHTDSMLFFDYGNAFLLECHRAGCVVDTSIPSYVECIMGPEFFDYGFGPYRWVCTSGEPNDLQITDTIASEVLRDQMSDPANGKIHSQLTANYEWITSAMENKLVVGSQARILYSDLEGRIECAVRMNHAIRDKKILSPIVIGRDHHDVSGTDSPWRETSNIKDGSNLTADMSVQNVIGDAMRGATWVSLHNGGGTGWGVASNGGFGLVLDGTERAERRAREMIFFDVANGLTRRARAGNPHAMETIQRLAKRFPDYQPFLPALGEQE